jgi:hypothetical protein
MRIKYQVILLLLLFIILGSCKVFRFKGTVYEKEIDLDDLIQNYVSGQTNFRSLTISRVLINFSDNHTEMDFRGSLRMLRDSAILISLNAGFGIEIGRGLMTTSEIQVIDRINSEYLLLNYYDVRNFVGFNAKFSQLQSLLTNSFDVYEIIDCGNIEIMPENEHYNLYCRESTFIEGYDQMRIFFRKSDFVIEKIELLNSISNRFVIIEYGNFNSFPGGVVLPGELSISVNAPGDRKRLILRYQRMEINTVSQIHFVVPQRYLQ